MCAMQNDAKKITSPCTLLPPFSVLKDGMNLNENSTQRTMVNLRTLWVPLNSIRLFVQKSTLLCLVLTFNHGLAEKLDLTNN